MTTKGFIIQVALMAAALLAASPVLSDDTAPIPEVKSQLEKWFNDNVGPLSQRTKTLDPALVAAENNGVKVVKVMKDGSGDFKSVTDAINSIPSGNTKRVIVYIGGGTYFEKMRISRTKPFVTLYGDPKNIPNLTYNGTALQYGTVDSASLIVESDYFVAVNIIFSNSAPKPGPQTKLAQAVAMRISGDKAAFYGCKFVGFQDTLCDDRGKHFFKDCTVQGTVDFIFGSGKSLYLNTKLVAVGDIGGVIAAQARVNDLDDIAFSFVQCEVTGTADDTYLGRAWMARPRVVYAYTTMSNVVNPLGWSDNSQPQVDQTVYFGEYKNNGPGSDAKGRAKFTKMLSDSEARPFLNLGFIRASTWLLPPPTPKI